MPETPLSSIPPQTRAVGLKLIIVGILAVVMWIPALFIYALSYERSGRAESVKQEIYEREGGEQRVIGPFLIIPAIEQVEGYRSSGEEEGSVKPVRRTYALMPKTLNGDIDLKTDQRQRSIYTATIYEAALSFSGAFDLSTIEIAPNTELLWDEARLVVGLGSAQSLAGVRDAPQLSLNGIKQKTEFQPGYPILRGPADSTRRQSGTGLSLPVKLMNNGGSVSFDFAMTLSGGGSFGFAPIGNETAITARSDWPHPGFQGQIAPLNREISDNGFSAKWSTTSLSRLVPDSLSLDSDPGHSLSQQIAVVELLDPSSPYSKINRSLKYALLFMGLIFLTVFVLEILFGSRAHPAQYILIGMAQVLFFLMVLALSEHMNFDMAFLVMSVVTVLLSGFYAASIFQKKTGGIFGAFAFSSVYGLIWLLMKSEDYALLIGASCAFSALAITMYVTRNVNWYGPAREQHQTAS